MHKQCFDCTNHRNVNMPRCLQTHEDTSTPIEIKNSWKLFSFAPFFRVACWRAFLPFERKVFLCCVEIPPHVYWFFLSTLMRCFSPRSVWLHSTCECLDSTFPRLFSFLAFNESRWRNIIRLWLINSAHGDSICSIKGENCIEMYAHVLFFGIASNYVEDGLR